MTFDEWFDGYWNGTGKDSHELRFRMRAAWDAAAKAEREACAKIVDVADGAQGWEIRGGEEGIELLRDMAAAIRAR